MKNKQRRVMYHRDLWTLECFEAPIEVDDFVHDAVGRCEGTQVDTFVLQITYNFYPSKLTVEDYVSETDAPVGLQGNHAVWAPAGGMTASSWRELENTKIFKEQNIDPIAVLLEAAHRAGLDFFAGIRMNDVHHAQWHWHPRFWVEHPEFRIGDHPEYRIPRPGFRAPGGTFGTMVDDRIPAALDYLHDEVRAYKLSVIEEVAQAYDVQGIELDFTRHPFFFKPSEVDAGREKMTDLVGAARDRLRTIGRKRGRDFVLAIKVPPTLEACRRIGLDVPQWMRDRLVDIVTPSSQWHPDFDMPVEEFLECAEGTNCKVLAGFELAETPVLRNAEETAEVLRAATLAYWKAGVHGFYFFDTHFFPHYFRQEMPFLNEIGDPDVLERLDKRCMVTRASNYDDVAWFSYPKQLPTILKEGVCEDNRKIRIRVGDDLEKAARDGVHADVTLRIRVRNLTSRDELDIRFNGAGLARESFRSTFFPNGESGGVHQHPFAADAYFGVSGPYHWLEFTLEGSTLPRVGVNHVGVVLKKRNPEVAEDVILSDVEMTIRYST